MPMPALFVSHGAPSVTIEEESPARAFLSGLGAAMARPRAILAVTAHWETARPALGAAPRPETIHDFYGFPDALYAIRYPAPGAPEVAMRAAALLAGAGIEADIDSTRGLDHGAWGPLVLMFPDADIPVVPMSVQPARGPAFHLEVGRALAPLRDEDVLVLGSGSAVHNLREFRPSGDAPEAWAEGFEEWLIKAVETGDAQAVSGYRGATPFGAPAHPRDEHLLPLLVAMGAGGGKGRLLHRGFEHGSIGMAAFAFGETEER